MSKMQGSMLLFTVLFIGLQLRCSQARLNFVVKGVGFEDINPKYIEPDYTVSKLVDDNKGGVMISSKIKIIKEFPKDAMYRFTVLKYSMEADQRPVKAVLTGNLCAMVNDTVLVSQFFELTGIPKEDCPPSVGTYASGHFYTRMDGLLDGLPSGKYQVAFRVYQDDETIITIRGLIDLL